MKIRKYSTAVFLLILFFGCEKAWENHYNTYPETVNQNVWETMQKDANISQFVKILTDNKLDTLFNSDIPYTVFAPSNEAMQKIEISTIDTTLLRYHLVSHFMQSEDANGVRKVKTLSNKFAWFKNNAGVTQLDGISINYESPLFINGKYFILADVAKPLPNMYEFFASNNAVLKDYIDSRDSVALDLENSKPIGFNDAGSTVFDSIVVIYNLFEKYFFPVKHEFRNKSATIVFPLKDDYQNALTQMALNIGNGYTDYTNIPSIWQQQILVPYLLHRGVFENMVEPEEFVLYDNIKKRRMKNIQGDSIEVRYIPASKNVCSNGYVYNYSNFQIPDSLYNVALRFETEALLIETGINKYTWSDSVKLNSDLTIPPFKEFVSTASNDSTVRILFTNGYAGKYSVEFKSQYLFPRKYLMVINTHMDVGGIYDIYVNDVLIRTFDYYDFFRYKGGIIPSVTGGRYVPVGRYNSFDMYVDNITEFSKARIKIEYKGPGKVSSNGLVLDYIDFIPVKN